MLANYPNPCPVCGLELTEVYEDYMDTILLESKHECAAGHYSDTYSYGHTLLVIGEVEIHRPWSNTLADIVVFNAEVKELIEKAKRNAAEDSAR